MAEGPKEDIVTLDDGRLARRTVDIFGGITLIPLDRSEMFYKPPEGMNVVQEGNFIIHKPH